VRTFHVVETERLNVLHCNLNSQFTEITFEQRVDKELSRVNWKVRDIFP